MTVHISENYNYARSEVLVGERREAETPSVIVSNAERDLSIMFAIGTTCPELHLTVQELAEHVHGCQAVLAHELWRQGGGRNVPRSAKKTPPRFPVRWPEWKHPDARLRTHIKEALEGDSNDAEHDALAAVAESMGIEWDA